MQLTFCGANNTSNARPERVRVLFFPLSDVEDTLYKAVIDVFKGERNKTYRSDNKNSKEDPAWLHEQGMSDEVGRNN